MWIKLTTAGKQDNLSKSTLHDFRSNAREKNFWQIGFNPPENKTVNESSAVLIDEVKEFEYDLTKTDWIDSQNRLPLSQYLPDPKLSQLMGNCIDTEICWKELTLKLLYYKPLR